MLDLASEQVAGATMEDVSTVLYYKVLQWAGYSRNLKVAALERKLKKDGRYDDFQARFRATIGEEWRDYKNDPLVVDSLLPELAHEMYPELFRTPQSFTTTTSEFVTLLNDRVKEMLDIVRETAGKEYVLFVIDEVGQYVGSNQNMILNLQGLAENLKNLGDGKAWILGTAQQTLTEDDPRAALNSPELYKLKDRFPIQIDLESRDIKEICYRRLLGKSPAGAKELGNASTRRARRCATTPSCRTPSTTTPTLTAIPSSTSIPSCPPTSTSCCTCSGRWPSPPAASACARRSRSSRRS